MEQTAQAEMHRLLFDAPIGELAEAQGISLEEAMDLRVEKSLEAAMPSIEVSVRPIPPQGKVLGFASIKIGGMVVDDFKVVDGKNGIFLGAPSKADSTARSGYRSTVRITDRGLQERLNDLTADAYGRAVEKLIARAEAVRPGSIKEQMAQAEKEAKRANDSRSAMDKGTEARDDR